MASPISWAISVVTGATTDTEPSIIISFDSAKYIFNAAENSNRAFTQKKAHRKSTRAFFLTQAGAQRAGGLAGMLMSSADQMLNTLDVVGPPGITHSVASMRSYIYRNSMSVNVNEVSLSPDLTSPRPPCTYQDKNIAVYSFPVLDSSATPISVDSSEAQSLEIVTETGSTKRKREPIEALKELMDSDDFSPEKLDGQLAQEWRKLMIKTMFPAAAKGQSSSPTRRCGPPNKRQKTGSSEPRSPQSKNFDMYSRPRIPTGYHQQLPKFTRPWSAAPPTLAYVVVGPSVRGKFDVEKSIAIGVPKNMRSRLTDGQSITVKVKDGDKTVEKVIHPLDCIGPSEIPAVAIILDIPSPAYISSVISSFEQSPFYAKLRSTRPEDVAEFAVRTVFHLCGDGVIEDSRYIEFMNGFPPTAHHIISSPGYGRDPVTFTTAAFNQLRLHQLDAEMFPLPYYSLESKNDLSIIPSLPANSLVMESGIHMNIRPPGPLETGRLPTEKRDMFHPATTGPPELLLLSPSVLEKFAEMKTKMEEEVLARATQPVSGGADVAVIPLGTASAVPTSSRNVSSTLIRVPSRGSILLDAGEGTYGQLARHFGSDVGDVLRDLRCIFVSHIHGDHHTGVAKILAKRRQLHPPPTNPLYLISIHKLHLYLRELSEIEDLGLDDPSGNGVVTIMSDALHIKRSGEYVYHGMWRIEGAERWTDYERSSAAGMRLCVALGLQSFNTIDVFHGVKCYGLCMRHQNGWSLVFSADTLPTQSLVRGGQDATLLIHEATMGDDEEAMARAKSHSTVGQAIEIARKMNAQNVLLTHFSARYPRLPPPIAAPGTTTVEATPPTSSVAGTTPPASSATGPTPPTSPAVEVTPPTTSATGTTPPSSSATDTTLPIATSSAVEVETTPPTSSATEAVLPSPAVETTPPSPTMRTSPPRSGREPVVALAFDHVNLTIGSMWKLNMYLPAIQQAFADTSDEAEEEEAKAAHDAAP
ncbi:hypothetical protein C8R46DRAFT_1083687 [Mycena filopes]|nr:hypothetical protein C8R46DRAFT_1083687 [Mycena filopes]